MKYSSISLPLISIRKIPNADIFNSALAIVFGHANR